MDTRVKRPMAIQNKNTSTNKNTRKYEKINKLQNDEIRIGKQHSQREFEEKEKTTRQTRKCFIK